MNQKLVFLFSGVVTAFLLVIGGGLAGRLTQSATAPTPTVAAPTVESAPVAQIDPASQLIAQMQQREAAYQQLIDQANQRLQQAYDQQEATVAQINQARSAAAAPRIQQSSVAAVPAAPAQSQPAAPTLSAEAARNIAIDASGGRTMIRTPELVMFERNVAYEIGFTNGAIYVDAYSGAVLYNGVTAHNAGGGGTVASQPPTNTGGGSTPPTSSGSGDDGGGDGGHDD